MAKLRVKVITDHIGESASGDAGELEDKIHKALDTLGAIKVARTSEIVVATSVLIFVWYYPLEAQGEGGTDAAI